MPAILALLPLLQPLFDKALSVIPDPAAKDKAAAELNNQLLTMLQSGDAGQLQINATEVASPSLFVSGWRPAVGWLCVIGLFVQTVIYPLAGWAATIWWPGVALPQIDTETLLALLFPMLGLGTLRTVEKLKRTPR